MSGPMANTCREEPEPSAYTKHTCTTRGKWGETHEVDEAGAERDDQAGGTEALLDLVLRAAVEGRRHVNSGTETEREKMRERR
jgi:hypothetical protein